jgi:hypothetical protein
MSAKKPRKAAKVSEAAMSVDKDRKWLRGRM